MSLFNELREMADQGGPAGKLAAELVSFREDYSRGDLSREEYEFLVSEVASVRAQQELASDEVACRWICAAAEAMLSLA